MVREEELHDLFTRALPDLREEPDLPDFRPVAKRQGRRLRRRRRVLTGVGVLAVGAVVAGSITAGAWLPQGSGPVAAGPGAATAGSPDPSSPVPSSPAPGASGSPVAPPSADPNGPATPPGFTPPSGPPVTTSGNAPDKGPELRLLIALRNHLPPRVTRIDFAPNTDDASYILTLDGGQKVRLVGTGLAVASFWGLPGVECGFPDVTVESPPVPQPGGPSGTLPGCERRDLPGGTKAVAEKHFAPQYGAEFVWVSLKTPQGKNRFLTSVGIPEAGPLGAALTTDELFDLASQTQVIEALDGLTYNQRW